MTDRTQALRDLIECRPPVAAAAARVAEFPFASDRELIHLTPDHLVAVLHRFIRGELTSHDVETWADALELREDVGCPPELGDALFVLSSPEINGLLTTTLATEMITRYGGRPTSPSS
ncbi:MAG: hypothetical protein H6835_07870 [Planctomycetes bacterium]|nr:hypothetical protein [Planctomycetota bacterium]